jgi:hypothetical protein
MTIVARIVSLVSLVSACMCQNHPQLTEAFGLLFEVMDSTLLEGMTGC